MTPPTGPPVPTDPAQHRITELEQEVAVLRSVLAELVLAGDALAFGDVGADRWWAAQHRHLPRVFPG